MLEKPYEDHLLTRGPYAPLGVSRLLLRGLLRFACPLGPLVPISFPDTVGIDERKSLICSTGFGATRVCTAIRRLSLTWVNDYLPTMCSGSKSFLPICVVPLTCNFPWF